MAGLKALKFFTTFGSGLVAGSCLYIGMTEHHINVIHHHSRLEDALYLGQEKAIIHLRIIQSHIQKFQVPLITATALGGTTTFIQTKGDPRRRMWLLGAGMVLLAFPFGPSPEHDDKLERDHRYFHPMWTDPWRSPWGPYHTGDGKEQWGRPWPGHWGGPDTKDEHGRQYEDFDRFWHQFSGTHGRPGWWGAPWIMPKESPEGKVTDNSKKKPDDGTNVSSEGKDIKSTTTTTTDAAPSKDDSESGKDGKAGEKNNEKVEDEKVQDDKSNEKKKSEQVQGWEWWGQGEGWDRHSGKGFNAFVSNVAFVIFLSTVLF